MPITPKGRVRYHWISAHRGYAFPRLAVAGASDTGMEPDSPARSDRAKLEVDSIREVLKRNGIKSRVRHGETSNIFCAKHWVTVSEADFPRAAQITVDWIAAHDRTLRILHTASLDELGYKPQVPA